MSHPEHDRPTPDYRVLLAAYARAWEQFWAEPTADRAALLLTGEGILVRELAKPGRFELGRTVATPGALAALDVAGHVPSEFLLRHKRGDWGELPEEDARENEWSLAHGARLFSAYATRRAERLWVVTERDRSATTLLLPSEY